MPHSKPGILSSSRGAAVVEAAVTILPLLLLAIVCIDFILFFEAHSRAEFAANQLAQTLASEAPGITAACEVQNNCANLTACVVCAWQGNCLGAKSNKSKTLSDSLVARGFTIANLQHRAVPLPTGNFSVVKVSVLIPHYTSFLGSFVGPLKVQSTAYQPLEIADACTSS